MEAKKTGQAMQTAYKKGGKIKIRGTGAATKGLYARGPMG